MYEIPAYLVWGFLESGKTTLIKFHKGICQRMPEKLLSRPCHDRVQWNVFHR